MIVEMMDDEGGSIVVFATSGRTHKELNYDKVDLIHWPHEGDSFSDVQKLIGELRTQAG